MNFKEFLDHNQYPLGYHKFPDHESAYCGVLKHLMKNGIHVDPVRQKTSIGSGFGTGSRGGFVECIGVGFCITNPRARNLAVPARKFTPGFPRALALWIMNGSESLDWILRYNSRGADLSDDGKTLYGAYGMRIHKYGQFRESLRKLRDDPSTRRAAWTIYYPDDSTSESRDIPCTFAVQLFNRGGELDMAVHMRSQSAVMVMPYDVHSFMFIQEYIATELGLELGQYYHSCGSLHYYDSEVPMLTKILDDYRNDEYPGVCAPQSTVKSAPADDVMPYHRGDVLSKLWVAERDMFSVRIPGYTTEELCKLVDTYDLDDYWKSYLKSLAEHVMRSKSSR